MMKERPIIMIAHSARAILDGSKTQTRRVVKLPAPEFEYITTTNGKSSGEIHKESWTKRTIENYLNCPYGVPGDSLWVRETWQAQNLSGQWWHEVQKKDRGLHNWSVIYKADYGDDSPQPPKWLAFTPRWASRLTLEIVNIRVERLQDISVDDIQAEGIYPGLRAACENWEVATIRNDGYQYIQDFKWFWDSINGKHPGCSWQNNPFVRRIEFELVK